MQRWLIAMVVLCSGCTSLTTGVEVSKPAGPVFSPKTSYLKCEIEGANDFEKQYIAETLSVMTMRVQQAIDRIVVYKEKTADFEPDLIAYCIDKNGQRELHLLRDKMNRSALWHEAAHAYDFSSGLDDDAEWLRVVGDGLEHTKDRRYPSLGVLKKYGTKNWLEDRAVWVGAIYNLANRVDNIFSKITDPADPRYRQKLDLLFKQGFIDKGVYEIALEALPKASNHEAGR